MWYYKNLRLILYSACICSAMHAMDGDNIIIFIKNLFTQSKVSKNIQQNGRNIQEEHPASVSESSSSESLPVAKRVTPGRRERSEAQEAAALEAYLKCHELPKTV